MPRASPSLHSEKRKEKEKKRKKKKNTPQMGAKEIKKYGDGPTIVL
jgi:hypothetical protein